MFSQENIQPKMSRREIIKASAKGALCGLGLAGAPMLIAGDSGPGYTRAGEVYPTLTTYTDTPRNIVNASPRYPGREKTITEANPALRHLPSSAAAFAVAHAGFVAGQLSALRNEYKASPDYLLDADSARTTRLLAEGKLGSIEAHKTRTARLLSALAISEHTVMSFVEEPDAYNPAVPAVDLAPPQNALQIVTQPSSGALAQSVQYERKGKRHTETQRPDLLYEGLRDAGVETIYCAGEYTFNPWRKGPACLGTVALQFMDAGFEVRGINAAVFPPHPQPGIDRESDLAAALYDRAIPFEEVVGLAKRPL